MNTQFYIDDGEGVIHNGTIDYSTGIINLNPDGTTVIPVAKLLWEETGSVSDVDDSDKTITTSTTFTYSRVYNGMKYITVPSVFKGDSVICKFYSNDGSNSKSYDTTLTPTFIVRNDKDGLEIIPKSLSIKMGSSHLIDGGDGKLYTKTNGTTTDRLEVGNIDYISKSFEITSDSIDMTSAKVLYCSGTGSIQPVQSVVFRTPGAPVRPGSIFIRATLGNGEIVEGTTDFDGNINGNGVIGKVDFNTGLCQAVFGEWVADDDEAKAAEWYNADAVNESGNTWKPYVVLAETMLMNCVITSYLPLDKELLGLDPVRLPMDGKVPIFRDGYIISIHHTKTYNILDSSVLRDHAYSVGRTDLDLMEVYDTPDDATGDSAFSSDFPEYVPEIAEIGGVVNYTINLEAGTVTFTPEFDASLYRQPFKIMHRYEDMVLASDVQVTGHIAVTTPLRHDYPSSDTDPDGVASLVSSVLPSGDLQSRAYGEFEQTSFDEFSDYPGDSPLASYNFVDFPITVTNKPSIKERWLILFRSANTVDVIGENFGVMTSSPVSILSASTIWDGNSQKSGSFLVPTVNKDGNIENVPTLIIASKQFPGECYWKMQLSGFGSGWQSGNCIRFNQDAANYPLWFIRTTLQAPATEQVDSYTIQVRGDSS